MNALNDLTTEVRFRERMRGYDFEEVDSYVKAVSRAVAQAREQISDLQQRLAQSEPSNGSTDGVPETREMLLRTLVLAQRTADTAVSEARAEAKSITDSAQERASKTVAEAETAANARLLSSEERASQTLAEAEENCQLILAEAKRTAAAELAAERAAKMEEIEALEATRAELATASAAIQARLDDERSQLRTLATSFQAFVEQFDAVTEPGEAAVEPAEDVSTSQPTGAGEGADPGEAEPAAEPATEPEAATDADAPGESSLDFSPVPEDETGQDPDDQPQATGQDPAHQANGTEDAEDAAAVEEALSDALATDTLSADTVPDLPPVGWHEEPDEPADSSPQESVSAVFDSPGTDHPDPAESHADDDAEPVGAPVMHSGDAAGPELFDIEAEDDDEFIEQLRQVVSSDAPLPNADAAMAAFFDHDEGAGHRSATASRRR